jgi:UDP-glucose 4-epimerase
MRILITGSSGQIGTNLALHLLAQGHYVFGVDKRANRWTDKIPTLIQDLGAPYTNFKGGIGFVEYPEALDVVVHFAAHAKVHELVEQPDRALANITMTFNVLEYCRQNRLPILFSSSREVYGDIHRYITDETNADFAYTESPYSASKIAGEALIYSYAQCYDLPYIVFRFSNVYGRYDNDIERMERVIPLFIRKIKQHEPITVYGEKKVLDFTYVDDCVAGVSKAVELLVAGQIKNETINLAYGQGNSLVSMATFIAEALNCPLNMTVAPARVGEVTHYVANIDRARKLLGYEPTTPLREGIRRAVAWSAQWSADHSR